MRKKLKKIAHIVLFAVAVIVFFLGQGIGLAANPTLGTALWVARHSHRTRQPILDRPRMAAKAIDQACLPFASSKRLIQASVLILGPTLQSVTRGAR